MSEKVRDRREFERLLRRSLDGVADEAERAQLMAALDAEPELIQYYIELMQLEAAADVLAREPALGGMTRRLRSANWWRKPREWLVARAAPLAAAVVFMVGGGVWLSQLEPRTIVESFTEQQKNKVVLVSYSGDGECIVSETMPGQIKLDSGEAVVRLGSGVELSMAGPLSMDIIDDMRVHLYSGQMVVNVPQWASGFTVNTPLLELWDLGTIFGVSSKGRQGDVFVFKGSVQVNESDGNAVDLCVAGEGIRVERGELPRKIAAEWYEAEHLFASVAGRKALAEPEKTFKAVDDLHELWLARYRPKPIEKKQVVKLKPKAKPAKRVSTGQVVQTKAATDRAVVALSESKQEEEMKAITNMIAATVAVATLGVANIGLSVPTVSGVQFSQRDSSRLIDISYNLAGNGIVTLSIETNGVSIGDQYVTHLTGDVNKVVENGTGKKIIWNAGFDWPEMEVEVQARVTAWSLDAPPPVWQS